MTKDETLKLALEALESTLSDNQPYIVKCGKAITAIKEHMTEEDDDTQVYKKPWVGLTKWEREAIAVECGAMSADWLVLMETVERALKEKNA